MGKLKEYLKTRRLSVEDFAALIDRNPSTVWRWLSKAREPNLKSIVEIEIVTRGFVKARDWV
jgi:transcriptional regulator with XRE-family HTH domain